MKKISTLLSLTVISFSLLAQVQTTWQDVIQRSNDFYEIQAAFYRDYANVNLSTIRGWKGFKRWEYFYERRVFPHGDLGRYRDAIIQFRNDYPTNQRNARVTASNWTFIGPNVVPGGGGGAGRINNVAVVPGTTNQFAVATPGGGVWRYNGSLWNTNTDFLGQIGFADVAINPSNVNIMYAASGDNDGSDSPCLGIFKTVDGGNTWFPSGLSSVTRMYKLVINPTNPNILLVSTNSGIYRTIDAGANWSQVSPETNIRDLEFKPGDPNTVYAAKMQSSILFLRSTDGGASFTTTGVGSGLPTTSNGRSMLAVTPADPNYIYMIVGATNNGYKATYRSVDGGVNWTTQSTSPNLLGWSNTGGDTGGQQWYDLAIAASPTNKDLIVVGGVNIWKSVNGGVNWTIAGHWTGSGAPYVHADIHDLSFGANGATVYAGCDGGIFVKDDINDTNPWNDLSNGLAIGQLYAMGQSTVSQNKILSGWQDNGTNLWSSGSWTRPIGGDGFEAIIDFSNDQFQYGEIYYGNIRRSTNGGNSFSTIVNSGGAAGTEDEDGDWFTPYSINPRNPLSLYVGKTRVYKSTDRGNTWTPSPLIGSSTQNIDAMAIAPSDTNVIYASKSGQIWKSINNGTSYNDITTGLPGSFISYIAVDESDANRIYVALSNTTSGSKVYTSTNGGSSWTNMSTGLPNLPANTIVLDTTSAINAMYLGMDAGVYYRDDNNPTWSAFNTNLPNVEITELEIQYSAQKIRAATYGRGIWESNLENGITTFLNASFTSNSTSICRGSSIQFTSTSTGNPAPNSWSWSFPGGTPSTSSLPNPSITYNTNGTYPVTLTVGNGVSTQTITLSNHISVSSVTPTIGVNGDNEICADKLPTFTAAGTHLGIPTYTWKVNGVVVGSNSSTFAPNTQLATGDVLTVEIVSTAACAQPTTAASSPLTITIKPVPPKPVITEQFGVMTSSNPTGNQWMRFGADIAGATGQTYHATQDGSYTVKTTINGCTSPISDVKNVKIEGIFRVFPVPNLGDLNIWFYVPQGASKYTLRIVNTKGQVVLREEGSTSTGVFTKIYDIKRLAAGTYHVRIEVGSAKYNKVFIKATN